MFDVLNTTGLDLNISDLFKINFSEICKKYEQKDINDTINKINIIYDEMAKAIIPCSDLIRLYQDIICAYNIDKKEQSYEKGLKLSQDLFFEKLFDDKNELVKINEIKTIFNIDEFEKISKMFVEFEKFYSEYNGKDTKYYSYDIIDATRYHRFWTFPLVYSYYNGYNSGDEKGNVKIFIEALEVTEELDKLFVVWSINQDKIVSELLTFIAKYVYNTEYINNKEKLVENIRNKKIANNAWWTNDGYKSKDEFEKRIKSNLQYKWLICLLVELLNINKNDKMKGNDNILKKLHIMICNPLNKNGKVNPNLKPDIEHIYARKLFENWDDDNYGFAEGIGNIMFLEGTINRMIKDNTVDIKEKSYKDSIFTMPEFNHKIDAWSNNEFAKQEIIRRGDILAKQLIEYIYE